jgi:hypothetical protein
VKNLIILEYQRIDRLQAPASSSLARTSLNLSIVVVVSVAFVTVADLLSNPEADFVVHHPE